MPNKNKRIIVAAALTAAGINAAQAKETISLTVVHDSPPTHVTVVHGIEPWMECVKKGTKGQVDFKYFPGGQLAKNSEMLQAMNSGIADLTPVPIGYLSDKLPLNTVGMLPGFGAGTSLNMVNAYSKAIQSGPLAKEYAANGIVPIWEKLSPPYQVVSAVGPLRTPADFSGKVLRSSGGSLNFTIESLGASPAEISIGDTYMAMERGTVDGTISFLTSIKPYNIQELMDSISRNADLGSFPLAFSIRKNKWESLPEDVQNVMRSCGSKITTSMAKYTDQKRAELYKEFADQGVNVYEFTPSELDSMNKRLAEVRKRWVTRLSGRGLPAQEVLDTYQTLLEKK